MNHVGHVQGRRQIPADTLAVFVAQREMGRTSAGGSRRARQVGWLGSVDEYAQNPPFALAIPLQLDEIQPCPRNWGLDLASRALVLPCAFSCSYLGGLVGQKKGGLDGPPRPLGCAFLGDRSFLPRERFCVQSQTRHAALRVSPIGVTATASVTAPVTHTQSAAPNTQALANVELRRKERYLLPPPSVTSRPAKARRTPKRGNNSGESVMATGKLEWGSSAVAPSGVVS